MKNLLPVLLFATVFCFVATSERPAAAQYPGYAGLAPYDGYYLGFYNRANIDQLPPYFAQFPPVYYSNNIIPRPYGWSPFALRPTEFGSLPIVAEPSMIENPYVEEQVEEQSNRRGIFQNELRDKSAAVSPRVIINPFVVEGPQSPADGLVQTDPQR